MRGEHGRVHSQGEPQLYVVGILPLTLNTQNVNSRFPERIIKCLGRSFNVGPQRRETYFRTSEENILAPPRRLNARTIIFAFQRRVHTGRNQIVYIQNYDPSKTPCDVKPPLTYFGRLSRFVDCVRLQLTVFCEW